MHLLSAPNWSGIKDPVKKNCINNPKLNVKAFLCNAASTPAELLEADNHPAATNRSAPAAPSYWDQQATRMRYCVVFALTIYACSFT
jgi:hypothetical protein